MPDDTDDLNDEEKRARTKRAKKAGAKKTEDSRDAPTAKQTTVDKGKRKDIQVPPSAKKAEVKGDDETQVSPPARKGKANKPAKKKAAPSTKKKAKGKGKQPISNETVDSDTHGGDDGNDGDGNYKETQAPSQPVPARRVLPPTEPELQDVVCTDTLIPEFPSDTLTDDHQSMASTPYCKDVSLPAYGVNNSTFCPATSPSRACTPTPQPAPGQFRFRSLSPGKE